MLREHATRQILLELVLAERSAVRRSRPPDAGHCHRAATLAVRSLGGAVVSIAFTIDFKGAAAPTGLIDYRSFFTPWTA